MKKGKNHKKLIAEIRSILIKHWDPIGVGINPNLADEYDAYIGCIIKMLCNNCSPAELASFLQYVEYEEIECKTNSNTRYKVAIKLIENCQKIM